MVYSPPNETGWTAVKGSVSGNVLTITAQHNSCTDTISWMVVGERKDQHMYDTDWTDADGKVRVSCIAEDTEFQSWLRANKDSLPSDIKAKVDDGTLTIADAD